MKAGLVLRAQLKSGDAGEIRQTGVKLPVAVERLLGEREECGRFNGNRFRRGGASTNRVAGTARPRQKQSGKRKKGKKNKLLHCRRRLPWNLKESASMVSFHNISPVRHFFQPADGRQERFGQTDRSQLTGRNEDRSRCGAPRRVHRSSPESHRDRASTACSGRRQSRGRSPDGRN